MRCAVVAQIERPIAYRITRAGLRALDKQTERWRRLAGLVDRLLLDES